MFEQVSLSRHIRDVLVQIGTAVLLLWILFHIHSFHHICHFTRYSDYYIST